MKLPSRKTLVALGTALAVFSTITAGTVFGSFTASIENTGNEFSAREDLLPPEVSRAASEKFQGGITGHVGATRSMYSYAQAEDRGDPPIGINLVQSRIGSPTFNVDMDAGSWTVDGASYNYRMPRSTVPSDRLVVGDNPLAIFARDNYNQSTTEGGYEFRYDPAPPTTDDVVIENGPGTPRVPDEGDTITYEISEPGDPSSLIGDWENAPNQRFPTSWDGSSRPVTVRFQSPLEYGTDPKAANRIRVLDPTGTHVINLGRLDLWSNNWAVECLAEFENSTMEMAPGNERVIVTLGELSPTGSIVAPAPNESEEC